VAIGTFSARGPVTFASDVAGTIIAENVTFNSKVNAYPTSKANKVTFGNGATIITGGLEGTTAVLKGALNIGSATTGGTLTVSSPLTLGSGQSIVLNANGGLALVSTGALIAENYSLKNAGSVLASGGTGVVLGIQNITAYNELILEGGTPTLVFGNGIALDFNSDVGIKGIALDVSTGGTITVGAGTSAATKLLLFGAGSIVAGNIAHTIHTGSMAVIKSVTGYAGILVGGSAAAGSVLVGSVGTVANLITKDMGFVVVGTVSSFGDATLAAGGGTGVALTEGSVAVFNDELLQ
jgi:hypothetical protein